MKLTTECHVHESSIRGEAGAFKIATSPKAFQILSANLYSDRVQAIVRELLCNALDAHKVASATDTPVEVKLPTRISPQFIVYDYGTGLSHAAVMELYTTYFASDKTNTNELTGGLGLGSKSPFAYTDQFTVSSRYDGQRRTYQAYISVDGTPEIVLANTTETDEPNGLEVSVPVKPDDIRQFHTALQRFLQFIDVNVQITGGQVTRAKLVHTTQYEDAQLNLFDANHNRTDDPHKLLIEQGNVVYPAPPGLITNQHALSFLWLAYVKDLYPVLHVPVGTFSIAPSREALSLTPRETELLPRLLDRLIRKFVDEQMSALTTEYASPLKQVYAIENERIYSFLKGFPETKTILQRAPHKTAAVSIVVNHGNGRPDRTLVSTLDQFVQSFPRREYEAADRVFWRRPNTPYRYAIEQNGGGRYILIDAYTEGEVQEVLEVLGLQQIRIVDLNQRPKRKARTDTAPSKTRYKTIKYKNTQSVALYYIESNTKSTAADILKMYQQEPGAILFIGTYSELRNATYFAYKGRIPAKSQTIILAEIPPAHTRVREYLIQHGGISTTEELKSRLRFDEELEQLVAAINHPDSGVQALKESWTSVLRSRCAVTSSPAIQWLWWIDARVDYLWELGRSEPRLEVTPSRAAVRNIKQMVNRIMRDIKKVHNYLQRQGLDARDVLHGIGIADRSLPGPSETEPHPAVIALAQLALGKAPFLRNVE